MATTSKGLMETDNHARGESNAPQEADLEAVVTKWRQMMGKVVGDDVAVCIDEQFMKKVSKNIYRNLENDSTSAFAVRRNDQQQAQQILALMCQLAGETPLGGGAVDVEQSAVAVVHPSPQEKLDVIKKFFEGPTSPIFKVELYESMKLAMKKIASMNGNDSNILSRKAINSGVRVFRLFALLIPPQSRANLCYLLTFLNLTSKNTKVVLETGTSNRIVLVKTFCKTVVNCATNLEQVTLNKCQILAFLIDNFDAILQKESIVCLTLFSPKKKVIPIANDNLANLEVPPNDLGTSKEVVSQIISSQMTNPNPEGYCLKPTRGDLDTQNFTGRNTALREMMKFYISNDQLDLKKRIKAIKQLSEEAPHVFLEQGGPTVLEELKEKLKLQRANEAKGSFFKLLQNSFKKN